MGLKKTNRLFRSWEPPKWRLPGSVIAKQPPKRVIRIRLGYGRSGEVVVSLRRFRTAEHRRSKRFKQLVIHANLFSLREVAVALKPPRQRKAARGTRLVLARRLTDQSITAVSLIAVGLAGSAYFGTHLETQPKLNLPHASTSANSQVASLPKAAGNFATQLNRTVKLDLIKPAAAVVPATKPADPPPKVMPKSIPLRIRIPSIGIDTSLLQVGLGPTGSIAMPDVFDQAGWYDKSPTPGERGPSVIVGHVDSTQGIAIFWRLRELLPGDIVQVDRSDGTTATFKVTDIEQFAQDQFPTQAVYGNINYGGIRLITCGGTFSTLTHHYDHNTVVYGSLQE